jgi:hypothetical protein
MHGGFIMRFLLLVVAVLVTGIAAFGQTLITNFDDPRPDTSFVFNSENGSRMTAVTDTIDRVGTTGASTVFHSYIAPLHSWGTFTQIGMTYTDLQDWSSSDTLSFWLKVTQAPVHPEAIVFRVHLVDDASGTEEELIYEHGTIIDATTDWINLKVPLYSRPTTGVELPDTTGFIHAPTNWNMAKNDGILDPSKIKAWKFVPVSTTNADDSVTIKFDSFYRTGHKASPMLVFTGKDFSGYASNSWSWGQSSISVVPDKGFLPGEAAVKWVQGDEWANGWTGWGCDINPTFDLGGGWIVDSCQMYMKCDTGVGPLRIQFESANGKRGTVFSPFNDTLWHLYKFPLRAMVVQDAAPDFDSTKIFKWGLMAEGSGKVGKTLYITEIWTGHPAIDVIPPSPPSSVAIFGSNYVNTITWMDTPGEAGAKYNVYMSESAWTDTKDAAVEDLPPYNLPTGTQIAQHVLRYPKVDHNVTYYYGVAAKDATGNIGAPAFAPAPVTTLAKGVPTISVTPPSPFAADGDLSEWASITPIELAISKTTAHAATNTTISGDADLSSKCYLAFDANNLYVAFDVTDDVVSADTAGTSYLQDCPDLMIGLYDWRGKHHTGYTTGAQPDYHFRFSQNKVLLDNIGGKTLLVPGASYVWAVKPIDPGYVVEAKMPLAAIAALDSARHDAVFVPVEGDRIGLDFSINDNDTPGDNTARQGILCYSILNNDNSWSDQFYWTYTWIGNKVSPNGVADNTTEPLQYGLAQNYPNPFNPSTVISYTLAKAGQVSVRVYDLLGREVATLVNGEQQSAGTHQVSFNSASVRSLSSGVYFYQIESGAFRDVKKMMLLK